MNHNWTPADDLAAAQEEQAKLRAFDEAYLRRLAEAYRDAEPHWQDDDRARSRKGFVAGFSIGLAVLLAVVGCMA